MNPDEIYDGDPDAPEATGAAMDEPPAGPAWQLPALVGLFVVLVLVLALSFYVRPVAPGTAGLPEAGSTTVALQSPQAVAGGGVMVYVVGEVKQPGVVSLAAGSRVEDAVAKAGGLTANADRMAINLAARVYDEQKIVIPAQGQAAAAGLDPLAELPPVEGASEGVAGEPSPEFAGPEGAPAPMEEGGGVETGGPLVVEGEGETAGAAGPRKVSLNLATVEDLEPIKGIGPELARRIVEYRQGPPPHPFTSVDDLLNVPGIGPVKLEQIRPFVDL